MLPSVWHVLFKDKCFVKDFIWRLCGWNCFPPLFPNLHSPVSMCLKPFVRTGRVQKSTPGWPPFGSVVAAFVGSRVKDAVCCEISWAPPLPNRWETGQIMALGEETIMLWLCESSICKEAILYCFSWTSVKLILVDTSMKSDWSPQAFSDHWLFFQRQLRVQTRELL